MDIRPLRRRATACLVLSLLALVVSVGQYPLLMYFYVHEEIASGLGTWFFLCIWLGPALVSFVIAVACFVCFGLSRTGLGLFRVRRIIGLILGILSLPLNAFFLLFGTFCILIGG